MYDCRGHAQGNHSHPSCLSPLPLSSKMCPLLIDGRGLAGNFTCLMLRKELVALSLQKSLASNTGKLTREHHLAPELNSVRVPEFRGFQKMNKRPSRGCWVPGGQLPSHPEKCPFPNPARQCGQTRGATPTPGPQCPAFLCR